MTWQPEHMFLAEVSNTRVYRRLRIFRDLDEPQADTFEWLVQPCDRDAIIVNEKLDSQGQYVIIAFNRCGTCGEKMRNATRITDHYMAC